MNSSNQSPESVTFYHLTLWYKGEQQTTCHPSYEMALGFLKAWYPDAVEVRLSGYSDFYIRSENANDSLLIGYIQGVAHSAIGFCALSLCNPISGQPLSTPPAPPAPDADTKSIALNIEGKTFRSLRSALSVRGMCGEVVGPIEAAMFKILTEMEKGSPSVLLALKKDPT